MATRRVLAAMLELWHARNGMRTEIRSIGGVNAFKEVDAGTSGSDVVFLASGSLKTLEAHGRLLPGSIADIVKSRVAAAVPKGSRKPDMSSSEGVRQAVLATDSIGYSTGPSGVAMLELFERWSVSSQLKDRLVQAQPGIPVGELVATGKATLGFQQLSELIHVDGVDVAGLLPQDIEIITTFSGAIAAESAHVDEASKLLAFLASAELASIRRSEGFESPH